MPRSIFWISGWSVSADWLADAAREALPDFSHEAVVPSDAATAKASASRAHILGGFSLGAHLLLNMEDPRPRILLAPFVDLKSEARLGGAVATTQLRQQLRWLKRDPQAAVADFRARIGFETPSPDEPHDIAALAWGLEQMLAPGQAPSAWPNGTVALAGRGDPLLDIERLSLALPTLHVVDAGHEPAPLLAAAARLTLAALR